MLLSRVEPGYGRGLIYILFRVQYARSMGAIHNFHIGRLPWSQIVITLAGTISSISSGMTWTAKTPSSRPPKGYSSTTTHLQPSIKLYCFHIANSQPLEPTSASRPSPGGSSVKLSRRQWITKIRAVYSTWPIIPRHWPMFPSRSTGQWIFPAFADLPAGSVCPWLCMTPHMINRLSEHASPFDSAVFLTTLLQIFFPCLTKSKVWLRRAI